MAAPQELDHRSLALQQEAASKLDPRVLIGQWIDVEGLGLGRVASFQKRSTTSPFADSTHVVEFFEQQGPRMQTLVLRRRKLMSWNKGRRFRVAAEPPAAPALPTPPLAEGSEAIPAAPVAPVTKPNPQGHDIFLSLRFGEAMEEAKALRQVLAASGESAFICEVSAGEDIKTVVIDKLARARLVVVLGTATYGTGTVNFSTKEEMEFFLSEKIPFVLVKMCDAFEEPRTRFNFGPSVCYVQWLPGEPMPASLVPTILSALENARISTEITEQCLTARKLSLTKPTTAVTVAARKKYSAFLSHFKLQAGTEARFVHDKLEQMMGAGNEIFLDSDDLQDLRLLLEHVKASQVLVLLQTKSVLERPWVILELYTAIKHAVPIVALNVSNAWPYDYGVALDFLTFFDMEIEIANPGAAQLLVEHGVDPVDVAHCLSTVLPSIISTQFNPNGSTNAINAAMLDLQAAMARAAPYPMTIRKDEWLAKRSNMPRAVRRSSKAHGANLVAADAQQEQQLAAAPSSVPSSSSLSLQSLAEIPSMVPELPSAYLVRESDVTQLKAALLLSDEMSNSSSSSSSMILTAEKSKMSKVGAHGMGGVGKTTIAVAVVLDEEIRSSFEKIVWVSVGQEPDIRELQNSIHFQLTESFLPEDKSHETEIMQALRNAAKGLKVLLVLDDVWDPKHEKPLNFIDGDTASRLLVTTRIRGLLKNAGEIAVGVLPPEAALTLLIASAEMTRDDIENDSDELRIATDIVELCGRLPLTLAVAGGMVADCGMGFCDDIVDAMKESHELEDDGGVTVETRVISTSVKMLVKGAGKNKDVVLNVFRFFAVFPEDVPVPAAFFNKMAPLLSDDKSERKSRLVVGSSLSSLLKYNLVKGSLHGGQGVFMHDIVRDYVINQHSGDELRLQQRRVVDTTFAARPEPDGFPTSEYAAPDSFEGYIARQLYWHMRGSLDDGEEPPDAWIAHPDNSVKANVALAVGVDALVAVSKAREEAGELVRAAEVTWAATCMKGLDIEARDDLAFKTADLLEAADDPDERTFESVVLACVFGYNIGSERNKKSQDRSGNLHEILKRSGMATFESTVASALACFTKTLTTMVLTEDGKADYEAGITAMTVYSKTYIETTELSDNEHWRSFHRHLGHATVLSCYPVLSPLLQWDPESFGTSEEDMAKAIDFYEYETSNPFFKQTGMKMDYFLIGHCIPVPALWYGNLDMVALWHQKALTAFQEMNLPLNTEQYLNNDFEVWGILLFVAPCMLMLGMEVKASSILTAVGFTWDVEGHQRIDDHASLMHKSAATDPKGEGIICRLLIFLSSPPGAIDEDEVNAWIPSSKEFAELDFNPYFKRWCLYDAVSFGARAFLKLGRDDDAYELASLAVRPEQKTEKKTALVPSHSILGQIAAKRGNLDEADGHFANALKEAKLSRLPMLEVLAARDWKRHLLEPDGRDCSAAEAVIAGACGKMKKTRGQLGSVLRSTWAGTSAI